MTPVRPEVQEHLETALLEVRSLFRNAITRIETIKPGERYPAVQLAGELGLEFGLTAAQAHPLMKYLLKGYPGCEIKAGRYGGIERLLEGQAASEQEETE